MRNMTSQIKQVSDLTANSITKMFQLYSLYYEGTSEIIFQSDLRKKDWVFLLYDAEMELQGFSTLAIFKIDFNGSAVNILYSGDTIVDRKHWGQQELAITWLRFAGEIKAKAPSIPLYWFLIVKGHRTYRYLSVFSRKYYPAPGHETPFDLKKLMDEIATRQFGEAYDKVTGIVRFAESQGRLRDAWAKIPDTVKAKPEVKYFLEKNPFYYQGDELVCLCELAETNLKAFSKRIFMSGFLDKQKKIA